MYMCTVHTNMYKCTVHTICTYICVTMLLWSLYRLCNEQSSSILYIDVLFVLYQLSEEEAKIQHLQNEAISLRFKLREEEMLRQKVEEDRAKLTRELLKMQTEKKELVAEKNHLAVMNEELTENLLSSQSMVSEWFTSLTTSYTPHYIPHYSLYIMLCADVKERVGDV